MSQNGTSNKIALFLYVVVWIVLIGAATLWLTTFLVGTLGDPFDDRADSQMGDADTFDAFLALSEKKVVRHLGEWELLEPKIPGHFHHIGRWYETDEKNFCIKCHGPMPHARDQEARSFLNMHARFVTCQTCHVRSEEGVQPTRFGWIGLADAKLRPNPDMSDKAWGEYGVKIIPVTGPSDNPRPQTHKEDEAFAEEFRSRMDKLADHQRVIANKRIHRHCIEKPVTCSDCHTQKDAFLPYVALGYTQERAKFLVSAEVADLVTGEDDFYIPQILETKPPEDTSAAGDI